MFLYESIIGFVLLCLKIFQAIFDIQLTTESEVYMGDMAWKENFNHDFLENSNMRKKKQWSHKKVLEKSFFVVVYFLSLKFFWVKKSEHVEDIDILEINV